MPIYFRWFTKALLSVGGDASDQNLPQSGRLLYCVIIPVLDIYPRCQQCLPYGDREGVGELSGQSETRSAILDVAHHYHDYERVRPVKDRGLLMVFGESSCAQCSVLASWQSCRNSLVRDGPREHAHHLL